MTSFRVLLLILCACLVSYTVVVVSKYGFALIGIFFSDMAAVGWPGQFNLDFTSYLILSALWVAWRHRFSSTGIGLGVGALVAGGLFFTAYLFIVTFNTKDDMTELLLGRARTRL